MERLLVTRERNILVNASYVKDGELLQNLFQHWLLKGHVLFAASQNGTDGQNVNLSGEAGYMAQCLRPSCECVYLHSPYNQTALKLVKPVSFQIFYTVI